MRDLLLNRGVKDVDLVVEGEAQRLAAEAAKRLGGRLVRHDQFGTATIELAQIRLDFSAARSETYPHPGALPRVTASSIDDDLLRRDFSINAMALGVSGPRQGSFLDPCGAEDDLRHGLIRVLHTDSFVDDPTRMLRAVRYEQRLGFSIEHITQGLLHQAVARGCLHTVSSDRVRRELELILAEADPAQMLLRASELSLLTAIYPGLGDNLSIAQVQGDDQSHPLIYLAALAYPLSNQQAEAFVRRLNMPTEWAAVVRDAASLRSQAEELDAPDLRPSQVVAMVGGRHLASVEAACDLCGRQLTGQRLLLYLTQWRHSGPYLNGSDLTGLGVAQGPQMGRILQELRRARLDGQVAHRDEEVAMVQRLVEGTSGAK